MKNNLKRARFEKGLSQIQLFGLSGIWPSKISLLENGFLLPSPEEKRSLARALGVQVEWLFPSDDSKENSL